MNHFSHRLNRDFEDEDRLLRGEVALVLTANSGRHISEHYVSDLAFKGILPYERRSSRKLLFKYSDIKNYVVGSHVGRKVQAAPTENALRQRAYKARQREQRRSSSPGPDEQDEQGEQGKPPALRVAMLA